MNKKIVTVFFFIALAASGNFIAFKMVHLPDQFQFVVLLGLIMFYPVLRYPTVGLYLMFILVPVVPLIRRLYYLAYSRPTIDPLIMIGEIILAIMLLGLFFTLREHIQKGTFRHKIVFLVLVYFVYMLLRVFLFNELPLGRALQMFRFYGPQVLLFFIGLVYAFEERHLRRFWGITVVVAVMAVLYGLNQFLFGYNQAEKIWFSSIDFTSLYIKGMARPFSFFLSPAAFADFAQVGVIALIVLSGSGRGKSKMLLFLLPLFWVGVLITSVRSNWVGMAMSLFVWLFIVRIQGNRRRLLLFAALAVGFLFFDILQNLINTGISVGSFIAATSGISGAQENMALLLTNRADAIANPFQEHSMVSRIALWKYVFASSADPLYAVIGRGVGVINADSLYVTYLANFGYPGLALITAIIVVFIRNGFDVLNTHTDEWVIALARAVVTMDIVFAIINLTGSHIHTFPGDTYFWFWNGVLTGLWGGSPDKKDEEHETAPNHA